jgi:hypothetical protein
MGFKGSLRRATVRDFGDVMGRTPKRGQSQPLVPGWLNGAAVTGLRLRAQVGTERLHKQVDDGSDGLTESL